MNSNYEAIMIDGMNEYGAKNLNINKFIKELIKLQREGFDKVTIESDGFDGEVAVYVTKS